MNALLSVVSCQLLIVNCSIEQRNKYKIISIKNVKDLTVNLF
jgi:hypothetical protein